MSTDWSMYRGDDEDLTVTLTEDGDAMDLTGAAIRFTAKKNVTDGDNVAVIVKTTEDGISISSPASAGIAVISIDAADTAGLTGTTKLQYDVQVTRGGRTKTALRGTMTIEADVSRTSP